MNQFKDYRLEEAQTRHGYDSGSRILTCFAFILEQITPTSCENKHDTQSSHHLEIWHEFTNLTPNHSTKPVVWRWWPSINSFKLLHNLEWIIFQWPIFVMDLLKSCNPICLLPKFFCWQKGIAEINICLAQTHMAKCNRTGIWEAHRALLNGHLKLFRFFRWRFKSRREF